MSSDVNSFIDSLIEDAEEKDFREFCRGLEHLSKHIGSRFFIRNLKVFKKIYADLQKQGRLVSNDLKAIVDGTDSDLFIGLKKAFSELAPSHLFRFMEAEWVYEAVKDEKLSFGNVPKYDSDDTEVEDYSRKCEKIFSEDGNREFMALARKKYRHFNRVEKEVGQKLDSSRTFISDIRKYSRACCFTEQWRSPHHCITYADNWKGACICFDTVLREDDPFKMTPYKMSYEPRTQMDLLAQFCRMLHVDKSGKKMLNYRKPSKKEIKQFCDNCMAAMIERMFSRTKKDADKDNEWRYLNVGKIDGREYSDDERWSCPIRGRIKYVIIGPGAGDYRDLIIQECDGKIPYVEINENFEVINNPDCIDLI